MAIPMALVLGFACIFYVYVATQWWREAMRVRREERRSSSAMMPLSASEQEVNIVPMRSRDSKMYDAGADAGEAEYDRRYAMGRQKARNMKGELSRRRG